MKNFNIFTQLHRELAQYFDGSVKIATQTKKNERARFLQKDTSGVNFNTWDMLNLVQMYSNSIFESGKIDSEGKRKVFLNISAFRADVASKQIDIDLKDFLFVPDGSSNVWPAYFAGQEFSSWAKNNQCSEMINVYVDDFPHWGTIVAKRIKGSSMPVDIFNLRMPHDAKSLKDAEFVIEEHKEMDGNDMLRGWDTSQLDLGFGKKFDIYERYGQVPLDWYKKQRGEAVEEGDHKKSIEVMAILCPAKEEKGKKKSKTDGTILLLEEVKKEDRPYEEEHWKKIRGRWLGMGEIENQLENQIAKNEEFNLRRRMMLWASKKIWTTNDPEVNKNLIRDIRDGDVLKMSVNGQVNRVDMGTQSLSDLTGLSNELEQNANQKSFITEVSTGEALPSGTPYRLGVLLTNAVQLHFGRKREQLGLFLKRVVLNQIFEEFKKDKRKSHKFRLFADAEGAMTLKKTIKEMLISDNIKKSYLKGVVPDIDKIVRKVTEKIDGSNDLFFEIPDGFYDTIKETTLLTITGEEINLPKKIETLSTLYQTLVNTNPEAAQRVLVRIMALTGENYDVLTGVGAGSNVQPVSNQIQDVVKSLGGQQGELNNESVIQ